ncbi:MAG: prepilin-type N-terminal cleavage/methylation domain-containing protein [Phycisphaeraceae bacterium]|nr:prepilin-type N-terminal cleavage/methylation domain-containing protein [Phycisphaeraceae bacterium]
MRPRSDHCHRHNGGFTLPEVLLASAVLLFIVAAFTQAVVSGQMHVYEAIHQVRATALAEAMMDEVLSKPYDDPDGASAAGPEKGEDDRDEFDNADDFDGYSEDPGAVADFAGELYGQPYQVFSRSVAATYTTRNMLGQDIDGLLITVIVTDQRGRTWTISRFVPQEVG